MKKSLIPMPLIMLIWGGLLLNAQKSARTKLPYL